MRTSEDRKRRIQVPALALSALMVLAAIVPTGCQDAGNGQEGGSSESTRSADATGSTSGTGTPAGTDSVQRAAETVLPSVVYVANEQSVRDPETGRSSEMPIGTGSGIVIREDGHILTNNHVIADSDSVSVRLADEDVPAEVVGRDPATDLAVIKIEGNGLVPARIGQPGELDVGEWVIAVGFPFGLEKTVTAGVVSGLGRSTVQPAQNEVAAYTNLIQTDAAINPGNSGGALADLSGAVVGVNTLIESSTGQSAGIGFAIPIDFAMDVATQLIETGRAEHTFMGVSITTVNPHGAPQAQSEGASVQSVEPGSPAADAGIREGDVIVRIGEEMIGSSEDVFTAVRARKPGDKVEVELQRNGDTVTVDVTLTGRSSGGTAE